MTSLKLKFRPSRVEGKAGTLYIRIIHDRIVRQIGLGCRIYPHEWNNGLPRVPQCESARRQHIQNVHDIVRRSMRRLRRIVAQMERSGGAFTADDVLSAYNRCGNTDEAMLCVFAAKVVRHLRCIGKMRLCETYASSIKSFMRFRGENGDIRMEAIDSELMKEYEHYLLAERRLNPNTVSFYMRNLRAIYNRAVDRELTSDRRPFKHVYTGVAKTVKRAVPAETIKRIKTLDLSANPSLAMVRDVFMLSFYLRGISFVDLSQLKKSDIRNGYLCYRRQKTNQALEVRWEQRMQEIVDRYQATTSPYLLPIITNPRGDVRRQYQYVLCRVNAGLKQIGQMVDCPVRLTTYCARHAWASTARNMHVPLAVISEAMGHESEKTTRIYLHSLDNRLIDEANLRVINAI